MQVLGSLLRELGMSNEYSMNEGVAAAVIAL